jgi:hypothetical protein
MACDLTRGRKVPCKDIISGISRVWLVDFGDLGTVTETSDEITDLSGTFTAFQYDCHGANSFEQTVNSSRENGTTFVEQVINLQFSKLSKEDNAELKLIAFGRPHICIETRAGDFLQFGTVHGCELTGGSIVSGTAFGDLQGYTLTFTAQEAKPANFISGGTSADPYAGMSSATVTVTVGTNS